MVRDNEIPKSSKNSNLLLFFIINENICCIFYGIIDVI
jgi:hypothetical protein